MDSTPKYMDIVDWTIEQIAAGTFQPKNKFLSEAALGVKFSCSRQTVRRALEVLEQQGHITRVRGSGTYISQGRVLAVRQPSGDREPSMTVGIISTYLDDYIFPSLIRGIEAVLSADGYAVQLASTNNMTSAEARTLKLMLERRVDGLIVIPTRSGLPCVNLNLYQTIIQEGIPLLFIDSFYPELSVPYVSLDDVQAGYIAAQHLIGMGHRNIAGIFSHINRQGHLRYLGYVKALNEQGIPVQDDNIFWYSKETALQMLQGNQLWERLSTCTAALCFNDHMALMLIDLLRKRGKSVPDDLSVVGIDNCELAKISSLTSVIHPSEQLGEAAAKQLLLMINGSEGKTILFPPQLKIRSSVRKQEV